MAACDTFRAAAVDQLKVWADRLNVTCYTTKAEGDAAGLAFDAIKSAKEKGTDILFIDTAGRLHNKEGLMNELSKIGRVIKKVDETAPHASLLVLDATTGQNAHNQVREFDKAIPLTGLIMTKLDGTAKGGTLISLAQKFDLPIHALGVGEGLDDLKPFTPKDFSHSLLGL